MKDSRLAFWFVKAASFCLSVQNDNGVFAFAPDDERDDLSLLERVRKVLAQCGFGSASPHKSGSHFRS
jgi:hypothetical protein